MREHRRPLWLLLGSIAVLLLICGVGAQRLTQEPGSPPTAAAFLEARARWQQRPFQRYRLVARHNGFRAQCEQTIDVEGTLVQRIVEDTCTMPHTSVPQTVDGLFAELADYALTHKCGPNGCACDWLKPTVTYNAQWGYPQQVEVRQEGPPSWQRWRRYLRGDFQVGCTMVGAVGPRYDVSVVVLE